MQNAQKMTEEFLALLKKKEEIDAKLTDVNKQITSMGQRLAEQMEEESIDSIELEGIKFKPKDMNEYYLQGDENKKWDECEEWFNWLKEIGEDGIIKVKESVHWATRNKTLKTHVEEGGVLPPFIGERFFTTVDYSKAAVKRLVNGA